LTEDLVTVKLVANKSQQGASMPLHCAGEIQSDGWRLRRIARSPFSTTDGSCETKTANWLLSALAAAPFLLGSAPAGASDPVTAAQNTAEQDKSRHSLLNPTPDRTLRDLTTDRPDLTESPFTVDAGRLQIETNMFGYSRSRPDQDGTISRTYDYATTNFRIGVASSAEFNVVVKPYGVIRTQPLDPSEATRHSGIGGVGLRAKINLWGNDSFGRPGTTALALLPFLTLPTDRDNGVSPDDTEGGLIVPFAMKLTDRLGFGLNGGFHVVRNDEGAGTHIEWLSSASLSYEWTERFSTYYEMAGRVGAPGARGGTGIIATGFTYKLSKNVQLDGGINIGVTDAADRISPFVGISARF
jgi:hypothetical protein